MDCPCYGNDIILTHISSLFPSKSNAARAPPTSSQSRRRPMGVFEPHIGQQPPSLRLALPRLRGRRGRRFCNQLAAWLVGWPGRYHLISHKCMESGLGIWHLRTNQNKPFERVSLEEAGKGSTWTWIYERQGWK